jgi:hypothetical protein
MLGVMGAFASFLAAPRVENQGHMKRPPVASMLLLIGGVLLVVGIPLPWSTVATTDGSITISLRGLDYAGYDIVTTVVLGLLLIAAAFAVTLGRRWGALLAISVALLACLWAGLVLAAAANPAANGNPLTGVNIAIGTGAYVLSAGALLALIGAVVSFRGRAAAAAAVSAAPSSV